MPREHVASFKASPALLRNDIDVQMSPVRPDTRTIALLGSVVRASERRLLEPGTRLGKLHVTPGLRVVFGPVSLVPQSGEEMNGVHRDDHFDESATSDDLRRDPDYIPLKRRGGFHTVSFKHVLRKKSQPLPSVML